MNLIKIWRDSSVGHRAIFALATVGFLLFVQVTIALPYFECIAGFRPFDTQEPLSAVAIAIQLGAYGLGATHAYVLFVATEIPLALSASVFFMLLWRWMFSVSPNRTFMFLQGGGILFTPFIAVVFDIAESVGFANLIAGLSGPSYISAIEFSILMHQLKTAAEDVRIYVTLFFAGVIAMQWIRERSWDR